MCLQTDTAFIPLGHVHDITRNDIHDSKGGVKKYSFLE